MRMGVWGRWCGCRGRFGSLASVYRAVEVEARPPPPPSPPPPKRPSHTALEFRVLLPPPNVTGVLHLGHALTVSIEDALCRFHAMCGHVVKWRPGVDHAGIATQVVVEKRLLAERGLTRHDLGREAFLEEVSAHSQRCRGTIQEQIARMGTVLDWEGQGFFTLDRDLSEAVRQAFVTLFEQGLVYRDTRVVNWCPLLRTALSDIEVDHTLLHGPTKISIPGRPDLPPCTFGVLHHFSYEVLDSEGSAVESTLPVSTTRPETIPGDTAVAVHPEDPRYRHLIGRRCRNPLTGLSVPIVGDAELVQMEFGSGVVKVTPAHSFEDFLCGRRHQLPQVSIFDLEGVCTAAAGPRLQGKHRLHARAEAVRVLQEQGLYLKAEDHEMRVAVCSRSGDILEPMVLPQWFVNCQDMGRLAQEQVASGAIEIIPSQHQENWNRWLENLHDWCISRQLWWGHRIPAYQIEVLGDVQGAPDRWVAAHSWEEAQDKARRQFGTNARVVRQDEDVLDTWFSSGLLPLSLAGWPHKSASDIAAAYPLSVMETGADILFFWVARMVMLCTHLHPTHQPPFAKIYLHSMVRDSAGRKMSKSLGNVIDPMHVIHGISKEEMIDNLSRSFLHPAELERAIAGLEREFPEGIPPCGADALRFTLLRYTMQPQHINMSVAAVTSVSRFCNKIWQASRFVLDNEHVDLSRGFRHLLMEPVQQLQDMDWWILLHTQQAVAQHRHHFTNFNFGEAAEGFYNFFFHHFCDSYVELVKAGLYGEDATRRDTIRDVLLTVLDMSLRIMHPMMPFLSEELWRHLPAWPGKEECLLHALLPEEADFSWRLQCPPDSVHQVDVLLEVIHHARSVRQSNPGRVDPQVLVVSGSQRSGLESLLDRYTPELYRIGRVTSLQYLGEEPLDPKVFAVELLSGGCAVGMPWRSQDVSAEVEKLQRKLHKQRLARDKVQSLLEDVDSCSRAPSEVVHKWRRSLELHNSTLKQLEESLHSLLSPDSS